MTIYEAAMRYAEDGVPLIILAGKEYGSGSSRDWAAKGTALLGVRTVLAESFERIHRSNLIGMGVLPLQLPEGERVESLGLKGEEAFDIAGIDAALDLEEQGPRSVRVSAAPPDGNAIEFEARVRLDTPNEVGYYRNGGILHRVLRELR
jgi:aconitate hydratase